MLVICEDCAKRYDVDEKRISGERAKFTCSDCGHVIVVEKPSVITSTSPDNMLKEAADPEGEIVSSSTTQKPLVEENFASLSGTAKSGMSIQSYLLINMIIGFMLISGAFAYLSLKFIPEIINEQIELRTSSNSDAGGELHVGISGSDVSDSIRKALVSPVTIMTSCAILLSGLLVLFLLTKTITKPMKELTEVANRISLGELDLVVTPDGPSEMCELAIAFERMRVSINAAVKRLAN